MTINFHKKTGKPTNVTKGHSAVWFSNLGLYVADNNGAPRLITAGTSSGTTTPVGVPSEPNMLYFNEVTKKHFISTKEKRSPAFISDAVRITPLLQFAPHT